MTNDHAAIIASMLNKKMSQIGPVDVSPNIHPRVSIVMGVYNEAPHIGRALDSLLIQTFDDYDLIVVDDGSDDDTPAILDRYQKQDARIQVIRQANLGLTMALINGCDASRGEYIARHDANDWSDSRRLAEQVAILDSCPDVGFVSCATQYVGPNDELMELITRGNSPLETTRKLLDEREGPPAHGSVMFRRSLYEAVGGYRPEFYFSQDSDLWMRMAERMLIAYSSFTLYFWRRDPRGISGQMGVSQHKFGSWGQECRAARREGRSEEPILDAARKFANDLRDQRMNARSSWGSAKMAYLIGSTLARRGDPRARKYFWQAIRSNPLYWRAWLRVVISRTTE